MDAPVKLAIRTDAEAGLIRAFLVIEESAQRVEIATLSLVVAHDVPGTFEAWKDALTKIIVLVVERGGLPVLGTEERDPGVSGN